MCVFLCVCVRVCDWETCCAGQKQNVLVVGQKYKIQYTLL